VVRLKNNPDKVASKKKYKKNEIMNDFNIEPKEKNNL
jgi:hypothetical protein